ncbi:hypothetical protein RSp0586 [Ralstonia pseudosolanacearum GMI1000]|uniref:Uncharacterized protein n=1 Tax=Ralstonia nicotianae (strain ATCC BAA-1114 / GMI1000) TaxID=267608 RepID=Q8XS95_RALN1|nr:hypothetical protein RSp0586 [Ralstonia pseudosolanacearum GMI1000]
MQIKPELDDALSDIQKMLSRSASKGLKAENRGRGSPATRLLSVANKTQSSHDGP